MGYADGMGYELGRAIMELGFRRLDERERREREERAAKAQAEADELARKRKRRDEREDQRAKYEIEGPKQFSREEVDDAGNRFKVGYERRVNFDGDMPQGSSVEVSRTPVMADPQQQFLAGLSEEDRNRSFRIKAGLEPRATAPPVMSSTDRFLESLPEEERNKALRTKVGLEPRASHESPDSGYTRREALSLVQSEIRKLAEEELKELGGAKAYTAQRMAELGFDSISGKRLPDEVKERGRKGGEMVKSALDALKGDSSGDAEIIKEAQEAISQGADPVAIKRELEKQGLGHLASRI